MATAAEYSEETSQSKPDSPVHEEEYEHVRIRFQYLKSTRSVKDCFVGRLPKYINPCKDEDILKGEGNSYSIYNVTYDQEFIISRPLSLEKDVCNEWFSNRPPSEDMAWMEIIRKKRSYPKSAKYGMKFSFRGVRIVGGSMTSPNTFVGHWKLLATNDRYEHMEVSVQAESLKVNIEKHFDIDDLFDTNDVFHFKLEVAFESLHDTIIVHKTSTCLVMVLNLKSSPKIYKQTPGRTVTAIGIQTGFENVGCVNTYCIEFDLCRHELTEIELLLARFIFCGFHVAYANLKTTFVNSACPAIALATDDFEVAYAWQCVQSIGYKVTDQLSPEIKRYIEQLCREKASQIAQIFYNLAVRLIEKPFFFFREELDLIIQRTTKTVNAKKDVPSHCSLAARVMLTPTKLIYLPKEPVFQNRILRQYGEDYFIKVLIRDDDFEKLSNVQSRALDNILDRMKEIFKEGFNIHDRHYEFLGCSNCQLREHSFWFFHPHDDINAQGIRKSSGDLSSEMCIASYISRFGLCFSSTQRTVDVDKDCVEYIKDVTNDKYCFTDGIGCISPHLAKRVAKELHIYPVPSAFQIRFGGCKGVVAQNPALGNEKDALCIRSSMKKFESDSRNLEILEVTRPGRLHLNRQVIMLLSGLGVPDHVFLNLQEEILIDMAEMLLDDEKALSALLEDTDSTRQRANYDGYFR
uniref:RNA-dependent RNA polymerase n=1 Tax=Crassostrea virginica TaxID=6565 RepID=A0A8B8B530_CRAVI|nr:RNA-dependent RNA polymerase 2-like isoform X1 [Crassostrea virginica]